MWEKKKKLFFKLRIHFGACVIFHYLHFFFFFRADLILGNNEVRLNPNNLEKLDSTQVKKIRQPGW